MKKNLQYHRNFLLESESSLVSPFINHLNLIELSLVYDSFRMSHSLCFILESHSI